MYQGILPNLLSLYVCAESFAPTTKRPKHEDQEAAVKHTTTDKTPILLSALEFRNHPKRNFWSRDYRAKDASGRPRENADVFHQSSFVHESLAASK
jgi:hypothetical protein